MSAQFKTRFWPEKLSQEAVDEADAEMATWAYCVYGEGVIIPVSGSGQIGAVRVYEYHPPTLSEAGEAFVAFVNRLNLSRDDRLEANRLIAAWREAIVKGGPYE